MSNNNSTPNLPAVEWVHATPKLAEEWLGLNHGNRSKRGAHIGRIARDMEAGNFMITGDAIKFDTKGKLIDGQHRLSAIVESGTSHWILVIRDLDTRVQDVLDSQAKRSGRDALFFNGVQGNRNVIAALAKVDISRAAGKLKNPLQDSMVQVTNSEIVDWYIEADGVDVAVQMAIRFYKNIKSSPTPLAYAIMATGAIDFEDSLEFFNSLNEMRTDGIGDPRHTLLRILDQAGKNNKKLLTATQIYYFLRAWNAWRDGEKLKKMPLETGGKVATIPDPH